MHKYCLQHQEEGPEGDVKTSLYKASCQYSVQSSHLYGFATSLFQGEIFRTRGGGSAVQFTDVEVLKHSKPQQLPRRSTRLATKHTRQISSNSFDSSNSRCESSMEDEQWTDVETRVCS